MWRSFYTLRFRLAALNLLVFGLIVVVLSIVLLRIWERALRRDFDEWINEVAESIVDEIALSPAHPAASRPSGDRLRLDPVHFPGFYVQICSPDLRVLERSRSLRDFHLPLDARVAEGARHKGTFLDTTAGKAARELLGPGGSFRLLTTYVSPEGQEAYYLQIAVSMERSNESVQRAYRFFSFVLPIALVVVGLGSWLMARRSLSPIGRVVHAAQELSVTSFDRRIVVPRGRDEVADMIVTINSMLDRLESGFRAHERFIADAAHELKTPVAVLLGEAQVLSRQARSVEEYDRFVAGVQAEMRGLNQIIDSLLVLARANAGFPISLATVVSLNDVLTEAVRRCNVQASQREVTLVTQLWLPAPDEPEPEVKGDEDLLCTMVVNIVRNAVRNSPAGGRVEVELSRVDGDMAIAIRDEGPGIPAEYIERIFDEFFRVPGREGGAAGLGLTIARGVARLHGGTISAANRPVAGCEFVIRLPLQT